MRLMGLSDDSSDHDDSSNQRIRRRGKSSLELVKKCPLCVDGRTREESTQGSHQGTHPPAPRTRQYYQRTSQRRSALRSIRQALLDSQCGRSLTRPLARDGFDCLPGKETSMVVRIRQAPASNRRSRSATPRVPRRGRGRKEG